MPNSGEHADAGRGEEGDEGLRDVGHVGDNAVALADAQPSQAGRGRCDLGAQLAVGKLRLSAALRPEHDGGRVILTPQSVLGVVERRAREPLCAGHLA